jgi:hypothetical protein
MVVGSCPMIGGVGGFGYFFDVLIASLLFSAIFFGVYYFVVKQKIKK